jgi:hypothetical protein
MDTKKPYILAVIIVVIYTGMYVVSKAAFDDGMNSCLCHLPPGSCIASHGAYRASPGKVHN